VTGVQTCALPISDEFHDEQTTLPVATRTRTCRGYTAESRGDARVRRPPDAVGRVPGLPGLDDFLRLPHRDDVVVGFQVGRNFDELYLPRTPFARRFDPRARSEEHTSELQSRENLVCRLLLEK